MKLDLNENDMMLATILFLAGTIAIIALKQLETINNSTSYQPVQLAQPSYRVPMLRAQPPQIRMLEAPATSTMETTVSDVETVQEPQVSELSPTTFLGYNENDDLVQVLKKQSNGEVVRRKIRDPEMSLDDLKVDRWVEYNQWEKENDMDWI